MHVCLGATCERTVIKVSSIGISMVMNVCCSILATIVHDCFRAMRSVRICTVIILIMFLIVVEPFSAWDWSCFPTCSH